MFDLSQFCSKITCGENIGYKDGLIVAYFIREFDQDGIRKWNTRLFCLETMKRPALLRTSKISSSGMRPMRICIIALSIIPGAAIRAVPTSNSRRNDYSIADTQITYIGSEFFDNANSLVSHDCAPGHPRKRAPDHM